MLNKYGVPVQRRSRIPCRCNKCGKRKTLAKYPEEYRGGEKPCVTGMCSGLMLVDKYRLQSQYDEKKAIKDRGHEKCRCSGHPRIHPKGKVNYEMGFCCEHSTHEEWVKFSEMMDEEHYQAGA